MRTLKKLSASALSLAVCLTAAAFVGAPARAAADGSDLQPIDFVVLVDESGSIGDSPTEIQDERAAAALLTQSEISSASKAAVIGFGSAAAAGQSAVDPVCPLSTLDAVGRPHMSDCVAGLHVRSDTEGNDTDFPNALNQALSTLGQAGDQNPKLIFMLTDGRLSVGSSPSYGNDPSSRQQNAEVALSRTLTAASAQHVQIWPLGFGSDANADELDKIAKGGYQSSCVNLPSAVPRQHVVASVADVNDTLLEAFAGARCAQVAPGGKGNLTMALDLPVTIPPIATDGAIEVTKRDPKAVAAFYDPQGRLVPLTGDLDGSHFETSGQNGAVEALRITNPVPGKWRVHLEDPAGYPGSPVSVAAIWQGQLRSFITVTPPAPHAGQQVEVSVQLQTRSGVVVKPADLAGITVSAQVAGDGFEPVTTALAAGTANSGEFVGQATVPDKATGKLVFTGTMLGQGVTGDQRPFYSHVQSAPPPVVVSVSFDGHSATSGGSLTGRLQVHNSDGVAHVLSLAPQDLAPGVELRVQPASVTVPGGSEQSYPFTVGIGPGTPTGALAGQIAVTDSGTPLANAFLDIRVTKPPSWLSTWWWALALAALVAAVALAILVANLRRIGRNGVLPETVVLYKDGREVHRLRRRGNASEMYFSLTQPTGSAPKLRPQRNGTQYTLRRAPDGQIEVRLPHGKVERMRGGGRIVLDGDLELAAVEGPGAPRQPDSFRRPGRIGDREERRRRGGFPSGIGPDADGKPVTDPRSTRPRETTNHIGNDF